MKNILSEGELQHIEHCNKVLREHMDLVTTVVNETESLLNNYLPILTTYINNVVEVRTQFGLEVSHIIQSTRQLNIVTGGVKDLISFMSAARQLDELLTPELIEKLQKLSK